MDVERSRGQLSRILLTCSYRESTGWRIHVLPREQTCHTVCPREGGKGWWQHRCPRGQQDQMTEDDYENAEEEEDDSDE